ncbi:hypothetical protein DPMN_078551 [Dreissena polymorpha]|uniref:Uncharacterized protein n=1 Tax=Dreissena polymorpha TaxID=45954 RepID=A0A9D3YSP8_DREPO|nr:hypothetical protein DPMN_078551 [Dreissena polymorpha]
MTATLVGPQGPLMATIKRRKLAWFGHLTRHESQAAHKRLEDDICIVVPHFPP